MKTYFIRDYSELLMVPKARTILLYGAGKMGDFFYSHEYVFLGNFQYVKWVVSGGTMKKHMGCPMLAIDNIVQDDSQIVFVTTTEMHHAEICLLLEERGIRECYLLTEEYMASRMAEEQNRYYENHILGIDYVKIPNMGDLLNELLFKKYYGCQIERSEAYCAKIMGLGSSLGDLFSKSRLDKALGRFIDRRYPLYIWGTGFIYEPAEWAEEDLVRNNLRVCALRGELSRERLEGILGRPVCCATGDLGLLARELIDEENIKKKYKVGIIPHYREIGLKVFAEMKEYYRFSKIINVRDEPMRVIAEIAECETVLSSSLHGAVVADALGVPNMLLKVSNIPVGDGFKYRDYYSGYGLDIAMEDLGRISFPAETDIRKNYRISRKEVISKINGLKKAMPEF